MAGHCCNENEGHLQALQQRQTRMLWVILFINAVMFLAEFGAGWWAGSTALLGDSLDMLGDAMVYGLSLVVVAKSLRWKAISAGVKGAVMLGFGVLVLLEAVHKAIWGTPPEYSLMIVMGMIALAANVVCLVLLTRHREDDVNMRSAWICSRNDLIANTGVVAAGVLVLVTGTVWPDVAVGALIAAVFLQSSIGVLRDARARYGESRRSTPSDMPEAQDSPRA